MANAVPDAVVPRPRFGRLSPRVRSSLVPRSIKGIGSGLACYGCSFLYLYGVHTNSKASKHIVSEKYAFKWLQTLVILYSCGHYVMFFNIFAEFKTSVFSAVGHRALKRRSISSYGHDSPSVSSRESRRKKVQPVICFGNWLSF